MHVYGKLKNRIGGMQMEAAFIPSLLHDPLSYWLDEGSSIPALHIFSHTHVHITHMSSSCLDLLPNTVFSSLCYTHWQESDLGSSHLTLIIRTNANIY